MHKQCGRESHEPQVLCNTLAHGNIEENMEKCPLVTFACGSLLSDEHMRQKKQTYGMSLKIQHANITLHLFLVGLLWVKKKKTYE